MLHIVAILARIGITSITIGQPNDPETEEEFTTNFTCDATWDQYITARDIYLRERGLKLIRKHRDKLLIDSDWVDTPYNQSSLENIEEWNAYRQFLRDLPSQIDNLTWKGGYPDFSSLNIPPLPQTIRKKITIIEQSTSTTEEQPAA